MSHGRAQEDEHPPKPVLTLRVGITGHRPKPVRFPPDADDRVRDQLRLVFHAIDAALRDLHATNARLYSREPYRVRLVSGMAEGADQTAVWARPKGWAVASKGIFANLPLMRTAISKKIWIRRLPKRDTILELPEIENPAKLERTGIRRRHFGAETVTRHHWTSASQIGIDSLRTHRGSKI